MRNFLDLSVTRPVLAACISLLLIAITLGAALELPVREHPDIDLPVVSVFVVYRGAPAEEWGARSPRSSRTTCPASTMCG